MCEDFLSGKCRRGQNCIHDHENKHFYCKKHTAWGITPPHGCLLGAGCPYGHFMMNGEELRIFIKREIKWLVGERKKHGWEKSTCLNHYLELELKQEAEARSKKEWWKIN
mmetsp:Transcript_35033/g.69146  ORF Transcript_35033/g.69146 Transcript_35033/m.69146 type:complete len:110 (-) Transcript_35033:65-394(-)